MVKFGNIYNSNKFGLIRNPFNNSNGEYGTVYNPFGDNSIGGYVSPEYGGGGLMDDNGGYGNYSQYSGDVLSTPDYGVSILDTITSNTPQTVLSANAVATENTKDTVKNLPVIMATQVAQTTQATQTANVNNYIEQGKAFVKANPLLSAGLALGLGFLVLGRKK